jgi:hypothetical protein
MRLIVKLQKWLAMFGKRLVFPTVLSYVLVLTPVGFLTQHHQAAHAEILVSTLYGLDFANVTLYLKTEGEHYERLHQRIVSRLAAKKLSMNTTAPFKQGDPLLVVTLDWEPIDDPAVKKGLYYNKIELFESVVSKRTPHVRAWTSTALYGFQEPTVSDRPTIEQIERDLDWLLDGLIKDYSDANLKSK